MTVDAMFNLVVLPSALFALGYFPLVKRLSLALVSPYAKADVAKRLVAAAIDGLAIVTMGTFYWNSRAMSFLVVGALYLVTGRPCGAKASVASERRIDLFGERFDEP